MAKSRTESVPETPAELRRESMLLLANLGDGDAVAQLFRETIASARADRGDDDLDQAHEVVRDVMERFLRSRDGSDALVAHVCEVIDHIFDIPYPP